MKTTNQGTEGVKAPSFWKLIESVPGRYTYKAAVPGGTLYMVEHLSNEGVYITTVAMTVVPLPI